MSFFAITNKFYTNEKAFVNNFNRRQPLNMRFTAAN